MKPSEILAYWFPKLGFQKFWFNGSHDPEIDIEIKQRFEKYVEPAYTEGLPWTDTLSGLLALIIILDQFTKNIYRGQDTRKYDKLSKKYAELYLMKVEEEKQNPITEHMIFALMPYRHSLDRNDRAFVLSYMCLFEAHYQVTDKRLWERFRSASQRKIDIKSGR